MGYLARISELTWIRRVLSRLIPRGLGLSDLGTTGGAVEEVVAARLRPTRASIEPVLWLGCLESTETWRLCCSLDDATGTVNGLKKFNQRGNGLTFAI